MDKDSILDSRSVAEKRLPSPWKSERRARQEELRDQMDALSDLFPPTRPCFLIPPFLNND